DRLDQRFRMRIWIGFILVGGTFFASIVTIYAGCRPLQKYWQIDPDPGNSCQGAIADPIVWVTFSSSVVTDIYLILIPLPILWGTTLKFGKKLGSTFVLGAGILVLICSVLKTLFVLVDPVNGAQLSGEWGTREAFTSVVTTNLPMLFPLFKSWISPFFHGSVWSKKVSYRDSVGFREIGGSDGNVKNGRKLPSAHQSSRTIPYSLNASDEHIVRENEGINLKPLNAKV
ncbi:hypothetical protein JX266_014151, partial [Neoarthrinium moseri]